MSNKAKLLLKLGIGALYVGAGVFMVAATVIGEAFDKAVTVVEF